MDLIPNEHAMVGSESIPPYQFLVIQTLMLIAYAATASLNFYRLILLPVEICHLYKKPIKQQIIALKYII
jgi:hypothetical protein